MGAYSKIRDKSVADDATKFNPLMCRAQGCPNRWTVEREGDQPLCSAHAWSSPHLWPLITQEQLEAETDRAVDAQRPVKPDPAKHISRQQALERLAKFRFSQEGNKAWAHRLIDRHEAGEKIPHAHLVMARAAIEKVSEFGTAPISDMTPIPREVTPPAWRGVKPGTPPDEFPPYEG